MDRITPKVIEVEMKQSYLDYAMSVIVGRALPDVRDGLKPVHRRILFAMNELGMFHNKPHKKCARIVGEVLGKYHPHGDSAVYDALVRMAQDFSLRYPLIDGHGNFGSIDGDSAAAMRYTEARLKSLAEELLEDLDKETVAFRDNFDASLKEPVVLPAKAPNLLINGSSGIAVGMATSIPPHNLREVTNATIHLIDNPEAGFSDLLSFIPAPDFPTGGEIVGVSGIKQAYATGQGRVVVRAVVDEEKDCLVIREIPYMVNKSQLIIQIADLVKDKRIDGIRNIRDESDRDGVRVVIELKSNSDSSLVLKQLFSFSRLQVSVSIMLLALVDNQPQLMPLKMLLKHFIAHREVVVRKRTQFDLNKAMERSHVLEGLIIALDDVDRVIQGIRKSRDVGVAKSFLMEQFHLTDVQAKAILEMRLQKLASLEVTKTKEEFKQLKIVIGRLRSILSSEKKVLDIIKSELNEVSDRYGDDRRTKIIEVEDSVFDIESLMEEHDVVITLSRQGYVKRFPLSMYREQHRGGKGAVAAGKKEEDVLVDLFATSTHSTLLCFTDSGDVHWIKAYQVPEAGKQAKGRPIVNLLNLKGQSVSKIIPVKFFDNRFVIMVTKKGRIKKTSLNQFSRPRRGGIRAIALDDDVLIEVRLAGGNDAVVIATKFGQAIHFSESTVRPMGRNAAGVRGISLIKKDEVIGMQIVSFDATILTITDKGYGKRSKVSDYRLTGRGGKGVANIKLSDKNGFVVSMKSVKATDSVLCMTRNGVAIRIPVSDIPVIGRATQGVRVMRIGEGDKVVAVELVSNGSTGSN